MTQEVEPEIAKEPAEGTEDKLSDKPKNEVSLDPYTHGFKRGPKVTQGAERRVDKEEFTLIFQELLSASQHLQKSTQEAYERGFETGLKHKDDKDKTQHSDYNDLSKTYARTLGYDAGVLHIVTLAENCLAEEVGVPDREVLVDSGKVPLWWVRTLFREFSESQVAKKEA